MGSVDPDGKVGTGVLDTERGRSVLQEKNSSIEGPDGREYRQGRTNTTEVRAHDSSTHRQDL